jgi:hypothetical protein
MYLTIVVICSNLWRMRGNKVEIRNLNQFARGWIGGVDDGLPWDSGSKAF